MSRAPSVWYRYHDNFPGDIIKQSISVPPEGATLDTYYCCLQWNAGLVGGGYCGIQDHPRGKAFIYSLWDAAHATQPITAVYVGAGSEIHHFGGEGTGLQAFNLTVGWTPGNWYTLVTRTWAYNKHTYYGFWIHAQSERKWYHIVTMNFPYADTMIDTSTGSFVEDWQGTGNNERRASYRHGFKRRPVGWYPFSVGTFNAVMEPPSKKHAHNYDAGTEGDHFYLASGGSIAPSPGIGTSHTFYLPGPREPTEPTIDFFISRATPTVVEWTVPESSTPQFRYTVWVGGQSAKSDQQPETRSHVLTGCKPGDEVNVSLEDILGRNAQRSMKITENYKSGRCLTSTTDHCNMC